MGGKKTIGRVLVKSWMGGNIARICADCFHDFVLFDLVMDFIECMYQGILVGYVGLEGGVGDVMDLIGLFVRELTNLCK